MFNLFTFYLNKTLYFRSVKIYLFIIYLLLSSTFFSQQYTLSGYVKDAKTGEFLIGATIFVEGELKGTSSNVYGFYSLTLKTGETNVKYSYIGYNGNNKKINLTNPVLSWEHEQFSLKQIVSGTLSHYKKSRAILSRSSIFDVKETSIDMDILKRNIQFIAESLAVYMYAPVSIVIMFI